MRDSRDETDRMNFTSIRAILFFGVPNQGMHINSLIPVVGNQANRGFLHTLEHNSETLRTQAQQFLETVADLQCRVISFYETQESPTAFQEVGHLSHLIELFINAFITEGWNLHDDRQPDGTCFRPICNPRLCQKRGQISRPSYQSHPQRFGQIQEFVR